VTSRTVAINGNWPLQTLDPSGVKYEQQYCSVVFDYFDVGMFECLKISKEKFECSRLICVTVGPQGLEIVWMGPTVPLSLKLSTQGITQLPLAIRQYGMAHSIKSDLPA
jgi:hypothetical protein